MTYIVFLSGLDEKFILRRIEEVNKDVTELLESFQFSEAGEVTF